jgi:hypothetical protein
MNVLFLDIDGVMNSHVLYESRTKTLSFRLRGLWFKFKRLFVKPKYVSLANYVAPDYTYTFDYQFDRLVESSCPQKWKWLSEWCNKTNTNICVSSVWKNNFGTRKWNEDTETYDYIRTPEKWEDTFQRLGFNKGTFVGITGNRKGCRGEEIKEWLDNQNDVDDYAIIDDDSDMLEEQFNHFHHSDPWFGLNPNHLYRIQRQFENKSSYERLSRTLK